MKHRGNAQSFKEVCMYQRTFPSCVCTNRLYKGAVLPVVSVNNNTMFDTDFYAQLFSI